MADAWDDSDDEWDRDDDDDDELNVRLQKAGIVGASAPPVFDDEEEDLALKEKQIQEKQMNQELKKKGNALMEKKMAEQQRLIEEEVARKAMELEAEMEASMSPDELRKMKQQQIEDADHALTDDLFGKTESKPKGGAAASGANSDALVLKDLKDHLKHAKQVGIAIKQHSKVHLAAAFLKEVIQECKDVLDDAAVSDIIKTCNVIKNDMVQAAKRKVKYQAQKAKKVDKVAEAKARKIQEELFGDNDKYDDIDQVGADYEDSFF